MRIPNFKYIALLICGWHQVKTEEKPVSYTHLLLDKFPNMKIVGNAKTFAMMSQFFDVDLTGRSVVAVSYTHLDVYKRQH